MRQALFSALALALAASASHAQPGAGPISGGSGGGGGGVTGLTSCADGTALADNSILRGDGTTKCQGSAVTIADTTGNLQWEGSTPDSFEGNFAFTDPTADWTWTWGATGGVSGVPSITGGASGSSTLTLDGDSTVTGSLVIDGAGKSAPSGGIDLRTSQSTPLNVIFRAGSSGTGYFYLGSAAITGYDSPVVVDGGVSLQIMGAGGVLFEGTTDNSNETSLVATDPTADRTITLPNATGTVGTFVAAPAAATDACVAGQYAVATGFAYFCVSANTWERVPIATW
jgi:hypothetical protein